MAPLTLSIIIPTFNRPQATMRALDSIGDLEGIDHEIIVVDDASGVPFGDTLTAHSKKAVTLVRHDTNKGAGAARNTALDIARGRLITFLDSDDRLLPGTLRERVHFALTQGLDDALNAATLIGCAWDDFSEAGTYLRTRTPLETQSPSDFYRGCWFSPGSCIIANRTLFERPGMRYDERLRRLEDYDIFLKLGAITGAKLVTQPIIGAAITVGGTRPSDHVFDASIIIEAKLMAAVAAGSLTQGDLRRGRAYLRYERAKYHLQSRSYVNGLANLAGSWLGSPRLKPYPGPGWDITQRPDAG
ncbi:MAG: glycosyltransferase family 2 protein [Ahrensia sp.]